MLVIRLAALQYGQSTLVSIAGHLLADAAERTRS